MKKYSFTKKELEALRFHLKIIQFHELLIKQYVGSIAKGRLNIAEDLSVRYDINKGEIYVDVPKKTEKPKKK